MGGYYGPLPALDIKPPQSPLEQAGQLMQLKSLMQGQQLQQQQLQGAQLQNQQTRYQLGQTQAVNQAYRDALSIGADGSPSIDMDKLSKSLATQGYGTAIPGILKNTADYQKSMADAMKARQDVQTSMQDAMGSVGSAIQKANYDPNLADLLLQHQMQMPNLPPGYAQQLQQIDQQIKQNPGMIKQIADGLVATSQKQQTFSNALQVAGVRANTPDARELADFLAKNPDKSASDYPAYKAAQTSQAELPAEIAKATNPQILQAEEQKSAAAAVAAEKARESLNPSALVGVAPNLVPAATAAATKAGNDYSQAQQAADDMQSMVDLAKKGNKIAYAYSPVTGVLQINVAGQTKRMNTTEIEQYGGAGSALDRIKGYFGKETSGASIPDNILNDMAAVSGTYEKNAETKYNRDLATINQNYGAKFSPINSTPPAAPANRPMGGAVPAQVQSLLSKVGPGIHTLSDGSKWMKAADGTITKQ